MSSALTSLAEVEEAVRAGERVLPRGGGTKPALCADPAGAAVALDLAGLSGIVEYDPAELTVTARAGTPLAELAATLAEHGQRLPFDPLYGEGGAETLGGAIATGAVGPGAFGGGTIRDFIVGVRIVDGRGNSIRGGGRVVKNAAGFDLPKLMVGSLGRLGVIVEATLKLFPLARGGEMIRFERETLEEAVATIARLARAPQRLDELDLDPPGSVYARISADAELSPGAIAALERDPGGGEPLAPAAAAARRDCFRSFAWVPADHRLVRVPITAAAVSQIEELLPAGAARRYCNGLNLAWLSWPEEEPLERLATALAAAGLIGVVMSGAPPARPLLGAARGGAFAARIRAALDPDHRFLELGP